MYRDLPLNNPIYVACQLVILEVSRFVCNTVGSCGRFKTTFVLVFCFLSFSFDVYGNFGLTFIFLLNILKCACSFQCTRPTLLHCGEIVGR